MQHLHEAVFLTELSMDFQSFSVESVDFSDKR